MSIELQPHQQRVVEEKTELDVKFVKLASFIYGNATFAALDEVERVDLHDQFDAMRHYSDILAARIERFFQPA